MGPKQKGTGVGKGRLGSAGGSGAAFVAPSQEESFQVLSLDQGRPPFAMAIRLTPEVLEDLKRAETEDVKCEMKFGVTPAGHVRILLTSLRFLRVSTGDNSPNAARTLHCCGFPLIFPLPLLPYPLGRHRCLSELCIVFGCLRLLFIQIVEKQNF
jgi:hypothetical protein